MVLTAKMSFTNEDYLPSVEELTIPELELTSSVLRAGAHHFGKYCDKQCKVNHSQMELADGHV